MLFNSVKYLIFFIIIFFLNFILTKKTRWIVLLLASYYFYMSWEPKYLVLILFTTLTTYISGILIEKNRDNKKKKKFYLIFNLVINLSILFVFKYFNFFTISISKFMDLFNMSYQPTILRFMLPVGISFYTFQAIGYSIDVYRGDIDAEKHLGIFALFLVFFPQLVAGPIERSRNLLPQFYQEKEFSIERFKSGFILIVWGLFKKIAVADSLAKIVDPIFNNITEYTGAAYLIATILFTFQLFCDFSAYSDIAIGSSRILGFDLMKNFNRPFFAENISDFWRRWHISLSTWFKDYIYIPLGGNRVSKKRYILNQFIVFGLSGLWHGANWNFVIWGLLHGLYLTIHILTKDIRKKLDIKYEGNALIKFVRTIRTFILFAFSLIFFRANNISDALYMVKNLFTGFSIFSLSKLLESINISKIHFIGAIISTIILLIFQAIYKDDGIDGLIENRAIYIRYLFYFSLIFYTILMGGYGYEESTQFIYFQF